MSLKNSKYEEAHYRGTSVKQSPDIYGRDTNPADYRYEENTWGGSSARAADYRKAARVAKAADKTLKYRGASQGRLFGRNAAVAASRQEEAENTPTMTAPSVKRMASF
jgi:hypothetical protein